MVPVLARKNNYTDELMERSCECFQSKSLWNSACNIKSSLVNNKTIKTNRRKHRKRKLTFSIQFGGWHSQRTVRRKKSHWFSKITVTGNPLRDSGLQWFFDFRSGIETNKTLTRSKRQSTKTYVPAISFGR